MGENRKEKKKQKQKNNIDEMEAANPVQNVDTEASGQKDGDPTGHMTPHTETEKGMMADDHRGDYLDVKEEILVSEAEEAKKKSVTDIGAILHSIQECCRY